MSNSILQHYPANLTAQVAGDATIDEVQKQLKKNNQFIPIGPFKKNTTIKEIIDYNLLGCFCHQFGTIKRWLLNTELIITGKTIQTGANVMKNVSGYDLTRILINAQGSLGSINSATFKLYPWREGTFYISPTLDISSAISLSETLTVIGLQLINRRSKVQILVFSNKTPKSGFIEYKKPIPKCIQDGIRLVVLPSEVCSIFKLLNKMIERLIIFPSLGIIDFKINKIFNIDDITKILKHFNFNIFIIHNGKSIPLMCENKKYINAIKKVFDPNNEYKEYKTSK